MGKLIKKYLLTSLVALATVQVAFAVAQTTFTDVHVKKTLVVDGVVTAGSVNCSNVSTTTLTANDLIGTFSVTAATAVFTSSTAPIKFTGTITITGSPAAVGLLGQDSSHILYISTSTNPSGWSKVGAQ
jgi:hypothetical protein